MYCIICGKFANFGLASEQVIKWCKSHKIPGCINLTLFSQMKSTRLCRFCPKKASFNYPGMKNPAVCKTHISPNMTSYANKKCLANKCKIRAIYGFTDDMRTIYCKEHRRVGTEDIINNICNIPGCKNVSKYNIIRSLIPIYCESHKRQDMVEI